MAKPKSKDESARSSPAGSRTPRAKAKSASAKRPDVPVSEGAGPAAERASAGRPRRVPQNHRTIDRVTRILEEVVYKPGMTFVELVRALEAAKSSVHGFISGLLANGWLFEENHRFYLGPAVYGLTLASGHIRAGMVTHEDLVALERDTGAAVFLGVQAGEHLIYIAEAGSIHVPGFEARSNIRRRLLVTAGGKSLLAEWPHAELEQYLNRQEGAEVELVDRFLEEYEQIRKSGIATNARRGRFAIAATVHGPQGKAVASVTLVGPASEVQARAKKLGQVLLRHVDSWSKRTVNPREAI